MARLPSYDRLTREQLESPGAATERQVRLERAVERVMRGVVARFLERFAAIAAREGLAMGAAVTYAEWARAVDEGLGELDDEQGAWLRTALEESDIPDVAYDSALVVLSAGAVEGWSRATTANQIRLALRLDAGPSELVAAGRGPRHGAPWDKLDQGGMSFMDRMKRDARTATTGLDGMLTIVQLEKQGFTRKRWKTRHDDKVRDTHREADGQTVPLDEAFEVGGYPLMYPGERGAPPALTYNCRCVLVGTRWRDPSRTYTRG